MQVRRYELPLGLNVSGQFYAPITFNLIHIALHKRVISLWAEIDPDSEEKLIEGYIVGTGISIPEEVMKYYKYVGTCIYDGVIPLVYHVYLKY